MHLKTFLRLIGILVFLYGIYLIFSSQVFYGTLSIILAFLIFPNRTIQDQEYESGNDISNDHHYSTDSDSSGGGGD